MIVLIPDPIPKSDVWREEVKRTNDDPDRNEKLLAKINAELAPFGGERKKVGYIEGEVQIQNTFPTHARFNFEPMGIGWVQFNTYDAHTKKPSFRTTRFVLPPGVLMLVVRSPRSEGDFDWYLLARRKYQFGGPESQFIEYSRGWVKNKQPSEMGWALMDRDFPGLRLLAKNMRHTKLGSDPWENTAEYNNRLSHHIIVVTLKESMTPKELKEVLVQYKLENEYGSVSGVQLEQLTRKHLTSEPIVLKLEEAAKHLNAHLEDDSEAVDVFFNEQYSRDLWKGFLVTYGWKYLPHLMPETQDLLAP